MEAFLSLTHADSAERLGMLARQVELWRWLNEFIGFCARYSRCRGIILRNGQRFSLALSCEFIMK